MHRFRVYFVALMGAFALAAAACTPPTTGGGGGDNVAPVAVAAANPTSGQAPLAVQFSSAGSGDTDGFVDELSWDFGDGGTSLASNPVHTYVTGGTFTATLTVTDDGGLTATATVVIEVAAPENYPPTPIIGANATTGKAPLAVTFDSSGSADVDGTIVAREWDFGDGSPTTGDVAPNHTFTAVGNYVVSLTVTDDQGASVTDTLVIAVVANQPPTAVAAGNPTVGKVPVTVAFNSTGTDDSDGNVVALSWDFGDGSPLSSDATPIHTYTVAGTYTATLTATDDNGDTDTATVDITVNANQAPTAVANGTPDAGKAPLGVNFSSAGSVDNDGSIVSYSWDFGDGSALSSAANPSHLYSSQGSYTAILTVTDDDGATGTASVAVDVAAPNVPPVVSAVADPAFGKVPLAVDFSSAGTTDPDGSIVSYSWNFGDGSPTSGDENPSHTYTSPGSYTATLTVTDDDGATTTQPVGIDVLANVAPTAVAASDVLSGKEPLEVAFDSSGSSDPDGTITDVEWDFGDGSALSTDANPTHVFQLPGTYTVTLTVTDDNGDSDDTTLVVTVNPNQGPTAVANATSATSGNAPLTVTFDSSASADPDGTYTVEWDFGDGSAVDTSAAPTHTFTDVGTYSVTLTVTDDNGATSTDTISVTAEDLVLRVRDGGNDAGTGQVDDPLDSIGAALTAAVARGKVEIHVAGGAYDGFSVVGGIDVIGGYDQSFELGGSDGATEAVVTGAPGTPGVVADGQATATIVKGLTVQGGDGANATGVLAANGSVLTLDTVVVDSGATSGAGSSAYGVRALSGSDVTILGSDITAQDGAQGAQGAQGGNGAGGLNGIASTGNPLVGVPPGGVSAGGAGLARSGKGADGAQNIFGSADGKVGEKGGNVGNASDGGGLGGAAGNSSSWGGKGGGGGTSNEAAGAGGAAGTTDFGAVGETFSGTTAGTGGASGLGAGGGGGGSGRGNSSRSGAGASGGVGGGGGAGGAGGVTGGASIALFSHDATFTVDNTTLTTGSGGKGGTGGTGGTGGKGGNGGPGLNVGAAVGGGGGGGGAAGGRGGSGGGGGTGGPSIAVFNGGSGTLTTSNLTAVLGSGGAGGDGGAGGSGGAGGTGGVGGTSTDGTRHGTAGADGATGQLGNTGSTGVAGVAFTTWDNGVTG